MQVLLAALVRLQNQARAARVATAMRRRFEFARVNLARTSLLHPTRRKLTHKFTFPKLLATPE